MTGMLILPWPPRECSPNARSHWSKKARATKAYRATCHMLALQAKLQAPEGKILVSLEFAPPTARHYDLDNLLSGCKGLLDGLADALGVNDRLFVPMIRMGEKAKGGEVRVSLKPFVDPS